MQRRKRGHDIMLSLLLLTTRLALASPPSSAEPEKKEAPQVEGEMIIWSGGATRAEAEAQKKDFAAYQKAFEPVLTLEPRVLESVRIEGLKPGFFILALGVCPKEETAALKVFQALFPEVYTRSVKYTPTRNTPALDCPLLESVASDGHDEPVRWALKQTERVLQGKNALVGLAFSYHWEEQGDFASAYFDVKTLYFWVDKKRRLLDAKTYSGPSDASQLESFKSEQERLVAEVKYGDPRCQPSSDHYKGWKTRVQAAIVKGKIDLSEGKPQLLEEGSCGYADEARSIGGQDP